MSKKSSTEGVLLFHMWLGNVRTDGGIEPLALSGIGPSGRVTDE